MVSKNCSENIESFNSAAILSPSNWLNVEGINYLQTLVDTCLLIIIVNNVLSKFRVENLIYCTFKCEL